MPRQTDVTPFYDEAGGALNVDPMLLRAISQVESGGEKDPDRAVSSAGAVGRMQVMPEHLRRFKVSDPTDPRQNIYAGAAVFDEALTAANGNVPLALRIYQGGQDQSKWGPNNASYPSKVAAAYQALAQRPQAGPAAAAAPQGLDATDAFLSGTTGAEAGKAAAAPDATDAFLAGKEDAAATPATPPKPTTVTPNDISGEGRDEYGNPLGPLGPPTASEPMPTTAEGLRNALLPPAGYRNPATILPFDYPVDAAGKDDETRSPQFNPLAPFRGPATALVNLLNTPDEMGRAPVGTPMSPENTATLFGLMTGPPKGTPLTAAEVRSAVAKGDARAAPLSPEFRAAPTAPGFDGPSAAPVMIDVGGGRTIPVPAANPLAAPSEVNRNLPPNMLDSNAVPTMAVRPSTAGPPTSAPGAVGADITSAPIPEKTPAQRIADLEKSVQQTAEERAGPQLRDATPYVEGIPPRVRASSEFTPANALDHKVAIAADPAYRAEVEATTRERNNGMVDLLRSDASDENGLIRAHDYRDEVKPGPLGVFDEQKPVDASGLVDTINGLLRGQEGKQAAVRNTLKSVLDSLHDQDGNIETLPSMLYGARKNLTDLLKKGVKGVGDMADDVRASKSILMGLLPDFDKTISEGAPKFSSEYLPQFHERSLPIDQMEFLQKYQTGAKKITDGDGYLQPNKVQKMLDDVLQGLKAPGVNAAKSLTDQQIQAIINVRNELFADKLRDRMASVRGSDSFQQINRAITPTDTPAKAALKGAAAWGAHGAMIASPAAGWGNALLGGYQAIVRPAVKAAQERKAAEAIAARKNYLLTPLPPENP